MLSAVSDSNTVNISAATGGEGPNQSGCFCCRTIVKINDTLDKLGFDPRRLALLGLGSFALYAAYSEAGPQDRPKILIGAAFAGVAAAVIDHNKDEIVSSAVKVVDTVRRYTR